MLRFSDDTGAIWSAPIQVNTDATTRSQFLPKIASDPVTGDVAMCWHDARNSATNPAMGEWCDSFTPATFPTFRGNVRVSDSASLSTDIQMDFGDYSGLTLANGTAHPIWADASNSTGDNPNNTAAFDTYTDNYSLGLFSDGFESNKTAAWSATVP